MPKVSETGLQAKLAKLSQTQASVVSVTEYCLFYYEDAQRVVAIWHQELQKAPAERKLALVYLANHILQSAAKAKGQTAALAFQNAYYPVLPKALTHCIEHSNAKVKQSIARTVDTWEQRRVFSSKQMKVLKDAVAGAGSAAHASSSKATNGGSSSGVQVSKLGPVGECLAAAVQAAATTAAEEQKFISSFTPDLGQAGGLQEVTAASTRLHALTAALSAEKEARQATITALQAEIATQATSVNTLQQRLQQAQQQQQQLEARMGVLTQQVTSVVAGLAGLGGLLVPGQQQVNGGGDAAAGGPLAGFMQQQQQQAQPLGSPIAPAAEPSSSPQAPGIELDDADEGYGAAGGQGQQLGIGGSAGAPAGQPGQHLMAALQGLPGHYQEKLGNDMQQLMASGLFTGAPLQLPTASAPPLPLAPATAAAAAAGWAPSGSMGLPGIAPGMHLAQQQQQQQQPYGIGGLQQMPPQAQQGGPLGGPVGQYMLQGHGLDAMPGSSAPPPPPPPAADDEDEPYDPAEDD